MPLRIRIALFFAAASAVVLVAGGFAFIDQLSSGIQHTIDSTLTTRAADIANAVAQQGADPSAVLEASSRAPLPLGGSAAQVLDQQGNVLSASNASTVPMVSAATIKLAEHETQRFSSGTRHRQRYIVVTVENRGEPLAIVVRSELEGSDQAIDRAERLLVFGGAPLVLLAGLAGWLLAGAALRPVERMRSQVASLTEDELGPSLDVPGTHDEIAALATTMNDLLGRVRRARARERRFVAEAGHELRTPLAILRGELELANRPGRKVDDLREALRIAEDEAQRLGRLAEDLLLLAGTDAGAMPVHARSTNLMQVVERAVAGVRSRAVELGISLTITGGYDRQVEVDPDRLRQALDNLLDNALRHAPAGTEVEVAVEVRGGSVACIVRDEGPGFPTDFVDRALDRFAKSSSPHSGGAGLGLSVVRAVALAHGGDAWVANRADRGAEAGFTFPRGGSTGAVSTDQM